jgi:hypothetical protein
VTIEVVRRLAREALCAGTVAGLAMIPFAALFPSLGLRVPEDGTCASRIRTARLMAAARIKKTP